MPEIFQRHVSGRCVLCGRELAGAELLRLASLVPEDATVPRGLARLAQGYCFRNGCDSRFYELSFRAHSEIDWAAVPVPTAEQPAATISDLQLARTVSKSTARWAWRQFTIPAAVGVGLLLALLLYRQWITGGSIPMLREAKKFTVSPEAQHRLVRGTNAP